jgi:hypothetical protein
LLNDFLPELKDLGLASALSTGIDMAIVKANRLNNRIAFFHMVFVFLLRESILVYAYLIRKRSMPVSPLRRDAQIQFLRYAEGVENG